MAYSWFSHCKKYLAALEEEKRFVRTTKARSLSHLSPSPSVRVRGVGFGVEDNAHEVLPRMQLGGALPAVWGLSWVLVPMTSSAHSVLCSQNIA